MYSDKGSNIFAIKQDVRYSLNCVKNSKCWYMIHTCGCRKCFNIKNHFFSFNLCKALTLIVFLHVRKKKQFPENVWLIHTIKNITINEHNDNVKKIIKINIHV